MLQFIQLQMHSYISYMSPLTDSPASSVKFPGNEWFYWICTWIWSDAFGKGYLALGCKTPKCVGSASPFLSGKAKDILSVN